MEYHSRENIFQYISYMGPREYVRSCALCFLAVAPERRSRSIYSTCLLAFFSCWCLFARSAQGYLAFNATLSLAYSLSVDTSPGVMYNYVVDGVTRVLQEYIGGNATVYVNSLDNTFGASLVTELTVSQILTAYLRRFRLCCKTIVL